MGMEIEIKNNKDGTTAGVTDENQLMVEAEIHELQHHIAFKSENTYHITDDGALGVGLNTLIHIKNTDSQRKLVISTIRTQLVTTSATLPANTDYMTVGYGEVVSSGGTLLTPINTSNGSGKTADVIVTKLPTVTGTSRVLEKHFYTGAGDEQNYDEQGALILGLNETITLDITASAVGYAYVRVSFMMIDNP